MLSRCIDDYVGRTMAGQVRQSIFGIVRGVVAPDASELACMVRQELVETKSEMRESKVATHRTLKSVGYDTEFQIVGDTLTLTEREMMKTATSA